jgi:hypothetical protein
LETSQFAIDVSDVPLADTLDVLAVIKDQNLIAEVIYAQNGGPERSAARRGRGFGMLPRS